MKSRKPLSLLLTVALLMTTLLSAVWLPLSAEDNSTRIPADAPAIRADVGDVIDLSSYTVELPDGSVVSGKDLTWYNKGAEKTVKSATPVIYTDAGKTVDLTAFSVQLADGTVVPASALTWHDPQAETTVRFDDPVIYAENGKTVDLTAFGVQFESGVTMPAAKVTFLKDGEAVTAFTPTASGVYAFTATAENGAARTVYVFSKDAADAVYTVYDNEFASAADVAGLVQNEKFGGYTAALAVEDGWLHIPAGTTSANYRVFLVDTNFPDGVNNYTLETAAKYSTYYSSSWWGPMVRVQNDKYPFYVPNITADKGKIYLSYHSDNAVWEKIWANTTAKTITAGKNKADADTTYVQTVTVSGSNLTYAVDGKEFLNTDLSAVSNMQPQLTGGRIGFAAVGADMYVDYIRVTATKPTVDDTVKSYTAACAGVKRFVATTAEGEEVSVYVLAKNAEDTRYPLYENEFTTAADAEDLRHNEKFSGFTATPTVEDGKLQLVAQANGQNRRAFMVLPQYLAGFSDYTVELSAQMNSYIGSSWWGPMMRVQNDKYPFYVPNITADKGKIYLSYHSDNAVWEKIWASTTAKTITAGKTTAETATDYVQTVTVSGSSMTYAVNGKEFLNTDLSAVSNMQPQLTSGGVGIAAVGVDLSVDYIRVYVPKPPATEITAFVPETAGVTELTAVTKDGEEVNIYVVAKTPESDTYVLYENDFDTAASASGLSGTASVSDGCLVIEGGQTVMLPAFIGVFGDYRFEAVTKVISQASDLNWQGFLFRSGEDAPMIRTRSRRYNWDSVAFRVHGETTQWGMHGTLSVGKTYTHAIEVIGDAVTYTIDDADVMRKNRDDVIIGNTGNVGIETAEGLTLGVDRVRVVLLSDKAVPAAPTDVRYHYTAAVAGLATGTVQVTLSADTTADRVYCYWMDENGEKLDGFGHFAVRRVKAGQTEVTLEILDNTFIPTGAAGILAFAANDAGASETAAFCALPYNAVPLTVGKKLYTFDILSDTHLVADADSVNNAHWAATLRDIATNDPDSAAIINVGDIVDNGKTAEYARLNSTYDEVKAQFADLPQVYAVFGGHEWFDFDAAGGQTSHEAAMARFMQYTDTPSAYFAADIADAHYIFFGPDSMPSDRTTVTVSETAFAWLKATLDGYGDDGKPVFMFLHQGVLGTVAGSLTSSAVANSAALKDVLKNYPQVLLFTGHSHQSLDTLQTMYVGDDAMCTAFNTSAVYYQMDSLMTDYNTTLFTSEGYFVEVYEDTILVRGRDFLRGEYNPSAQFVVFRDGRRTAPRLTAASNGAPETFAFSAEGLKAFENGTYTDSGTAYAAVGENDTAVNAALESRFHFYYEREGAYYLRRDHVYDSNTDTTDVYGGSSNAATGYTNWRLSNDRYLSRATGKTAGEIFRKIDSLVPLNQNGDEVRVKNLETTFDVRFESETQGAVLFGFRQQTAGKFAAGYYNLQKEQAFVAIGRKGITIAGGSGIVSGSSNAGDMYNHWQTETFTDALPQEISVRVRAVGETCEVWLYARGTTDILHHYTVSIPYVKTGTVAFAVSAVEHGIGNITLVGLDENGKTLDLSMSGGDTVGELVYDGGTILTTSVANGDTFTHTLKIEPRPGYALQVGSLIVETADGQKSVPLRKGFRQTMDGDCFTFDCPTDAKVYATFYRPTADRTNIACLGTSVNTQRSGLRFVHRLERTLSEDGKTTVNLDGEAVEITDWGVLIALEETVGDAPLTLELAQKNSAVMGVSVRERDVYFDYCRDFVDMSVQIVNIESMTDGASKRIVSRAYVTLADGTTLYGDTAVSSYADAKA